MFSEREIQELYDRFVKIHHNSEYLNRYKNLPLDKNNKSWRWEGKDFPRVISILEFEKFIQKYDITCEDCLMFNGNDPELEYLNPKNIDTINYENDKERYDLHKLDLSKKNYDFVMLNQSLEHLYNPYLCVENIYKHLRKDGYIYMNVPINNIPHSTPFHFWTGITPVCLGLIVKNAGFEILEIGFWGNKNYLNIINNQNYWPDYTQVGYFYNEINNPAISWILAKK